MADTPQAAPSGNRHLDDRLESWKEIATYLRRGERTVRRWEQTEGLPVYRHSHLKQATVYSFRSELDAWLQGRGKHVTGQEDQVAATADATNQLRGMRIVGASAPSPLLAPAMEAAPDTSGILADSDREPAATAGRRRLLLRTVLAAGSLAAVALLVSRRHAAPDGYTLTQLTFDTGWTAASAVSRDGQLLAYTSDRGTDGMTDIWIQRIGGGDPVQLTHHPAAETSADFSPDGTLVAYRSFRDGGGIYIAPTLGGEERRISDNGYFPRFSPDGAWIAFSGRTPGSSSGSLYIVSKFGGAPRRLDIGTYNVQCPIWTPDGKHLVFVGGAGTTRDWWVVAANPDQSAAIPVRSGLSEEMRRLGLPPVSDNTCPADWDETGIVFSLRRNNTGELWHAPMATATWKLAGPIRPLAIGPGVNFPRVWSMPGRNPLIFFTAENRLAHLFTIRLESETGQASGTLEQRTHDQSLMEGIRGTRPRLSSDGRKLAFASSRSGNPDIWLKDLESGKERNVTSTVLPEASPLLNADGSRMVFLRREDGKSVLYLLETSSTQSRRLCDDCGEPASWSADERLVLCIREGSLFLLETVSSRKQLLWRGGKRRPRYADLSPDGKWIALGVDTEGNTRQEGFVASFSESMAPDSTWIPVTEELHDLSLHWSPGGERVYYFSSQDGFRCLWSRRFDREHGRLIGAPAPVWHFHTYQHYPLNGSWISVARDKLAVNLVELHANIWKAELKP